MNQLEAKANNDAFIEALNTFDLNMFKKYMKTWQRKSYKKFSQMNYQTQKCIMCKCIVDNKDILDKELVKKANAYMKDIEVKKKEQMKTLKKKQKEIKKLYD